MNKLNIGVVGLGFWGTALAEYCTRLGHNVLGWSIEDAIVDSINDKKTHPTCFNNIPLSFKATKKLDDILELPIILVALPSRTITEFLDFLNLPSSTLLISAMKGFEPITKVTPINFLLEKGCKAECGVISGPSFAIDVIAQTPVAISAGANSIETANKIASILSSNKMRIYPTDDLIGVELGGALKNIIAVSAGIANGLSLGDSTKAALIARGLAEINRYAQHFGAKPQTIFGLSGLGDLILTTSSFNSRNFSFGDKVGQGYSIEEALTMVGSTVEGYYSSSIAFSVAAKNKIEMPITEALVRLFSDKISATEMISLLMNRPIKSEWI